MSWQIWATCDCCGSRKALTRGRKLAKEIHCDCGGEFKPTIYEYDIHVAMKGGIEYILGEFEYWKNYRPPKGLNQFTF